MSPETVVLFLLILLCALGGIGAGTHLAFLLASSHHEERPRKNKYVDTASATGNEKKPWITPKWRIGNKEKKLSSRIHNQEDISFAEFGCQFTGAEPQVQREAAMHGQDESYHYLDKQAAGVKQESEVATTESDTPAKVTDSSATESATEVAHEVEPPVPPIAEPPSQKSKHKKRHPPKK